MQSGCATNGNLQQINVRHIAFKDSAVTNTSISTLLGIYATTITVAQYHSPYKEPTILTFDFCFMTQECQMPCSYYDIVINCGGHFHCFECSKSGVC